MKRQGTFRLVTQLVTQLVMFGMHFIAACPLSGSDGFV
jgi:hypothetical protein